MVGSVAELCRYNATASCELSCGYGLLPMGRRLFSEHHFAVHAAWHVENADQYGCKLHRFLHSAVQQRSMAGHIQLMYLCAATPTPTATHLPRPTRDGIYVASEQSRCWG